MLGVLGVIFGATGDEGLAELLEGDGVDGVEGDPGVVLEEEDQVDGGLFEANGDAGFGVIVAQLDEPVVEPFRGGVEGLAPTPVGAGVDVEEIGLGVGSVQADDEVVGVRSRWSGFCFHRFCVGLAFPQA